MANLRGFLHVTHYLQSLYQTRKASDPKFSYEVWAKELGIKNRSFLRLVVMGKRSLNEDLTQRLIRWLQLDEEDKIYFLDLIQYSQSKTHEQRQLYGKKVARSMRRETETAEIENHFDFVSDPDLPKLKTLLSFSDIERTPENLARLMSTQPQQTREKLEKLETLGLAQKNGEQWLTADRSFKIQPQLGDVALGIYHVDSLKKAIEAQALPPEERRYRSLLVPLGPDDFQMFLADLQEFVAQTIAKYDTDELQAKRLYQINFNLFPVSQKIKDH